MEKWSEEEVRSKKTSVRLLHADVENLEIVHKQELEEIKRTENLIEKKKQLMQTKLSDLREQGWELVDGDWVEVGVTVDE